MLIKGIVDEDFINYKVPSMFLIANSCSFKCDAECGRHVCQNRDLADQEPIDVNTNALIWRYMHNPITKAVVFGGLEPFDQTDDLCEFISILRRKYKCDDPVVIYSGYTEEELGPDLDRLRGFGNIIVKFGRYKPDEFSHFDPILCVDLSSDNQYADYI